MKEQEIKKYPVEITLYRNATMRIKHYGINILTDPMLSPKESFMSFITPKKNLNPTVDLPTSLDNILNKINLVIVSHLHPDHFDAKAMEVLPKDIPIICTHEDKEALSEMGFSDIHGLKDQLMWNGITFTAIYGEHGNNELEDKLGPANGFIIEAPGYDTIYWIGNCILNNEIKKVIHHYHPRIIITHSGGAIYLDKHHILMNGYDTIDIAKQAPKSKIVAVHLDALDHCKETRESLRRKIIEEEVDNIFIPLDGQKLVF